MKAIRCLASSMVCLSCKRLYWWYFRLGKLNSHYLRSRFLQRYVSWMDKKNERYVVNVAAAAETSLSRVQNILRSLVGDELISPLQPLPTRQKFRYSNPVSMANIQTSYLPGNNKFRPLQPGYAIPYSQGSNHPHYLRLTLIRRKLHTDRFFPRTTTFGTDCREDASLINTILPSSRQRSHFIYPIYTHNLKLVLLLSE